KIYKSPKLFKKLSKESHRKVSQECSFVETVEKEIKMLQEASGKEEIINTSEEKEADKQKVLSVIVPSYNVEDFLELCIDTLLDHRNRIKMEVVIINDGSTDSTLEIAKKIQKFWNQGEEDSIVRIIDKENGGHGSTINVGLGEVQGKYVRLVDADDWVDSSKLADLIDILENEDSDLVLTDYSEDRVEENKLFKKEIYEFLTPRIEYDFEDLCVGGTYGFNEWGPILATSTFKTEVLKKTDFSLTEKSPYVDMEFNMYSILNVENIIYYDLDIYRYFIGRSDQSISQESFKRNYLKHRNILFTMIKFVETNTDIPSKKRQYIINKLIVPMINSHYVIMIQFYKSIPKFLRYDKELRRYPEYYNHPWVVNRNLKFIRKTRGLTIPMRDFISVVRKIPGVSKVIDYSKNLILIK
ncbi:MAG: AcbV, partial [candidate division WS6 bacterium 34_10]